MLLLTAAFELSYLRNYRTVPLGFSTSFLNLIGRLCIVLEKVEAIVRMRLLAIAFGVLLSPPANAQGLFEALFGQRYSPQTLREVPRDEVRTTKRARVKSAEVRVPTLSELSGSQISRYVEPAKPEPYIAPPVAPGPLGRFLNDPTLRAGDIVATEQGLMVYRGGASSRHVEANFAPIGESKKLVGDKRQQLVALDRELRRYALGNVRITQSSRLVVAQDPIVAQDLKRTRRR